MNAAAQKLQSYDPTCISPRQSNIIKGTKGESSGSKAADEAVLAVAGIHSGVGGFAGRLGRRLPRSRPKGGQVRRSAVRTRCVPEHRRFIGESAP